METYSFSAFPPNIGTVHVAYFEDVTNAAAIRKRLVDAARMEGPEGDAARQAVDFAFVEADLLVSKSHLTTAILSTLLTSLPPAATATLPAPPAPKTRTYNLHSELLMALSPNNNISDAIRRFGVGDDTRRLVVVRFGEATPAEAVWKAIDAVVDGRLVEVGRLDELPVNWGRVDKVYKVAEMNTLKIDDVERAKRDAIVSSVAVKHAM